MRTYSRRANAARTSDAVFEENVFPSSAWEQEVALDDDEGSMLKRGKSTKTKEVKGGLLIKQEKKKKKTGQKKKDAQSKSSDELLSVPEYSFDNDPLFGKGLQPVKAGKTSRRKKRSSSNHSKPKSKSSRKDSEPPVSELVMESTVRDEKSKPPAEQLRSAVKVSDWLAKSDPDTSEHGESSMEVWRDVHGISGEEGRYKLFPKEFFLNLNAIPPEDDYEIINQDQFIKARKDAFLSKLTHTSKNIYPIYNGNGDIVTYTSSSDTADITETQTGTTYTGTQTVTQTGSSFTRAQTVATGTVTQTCSNFTEAQTGTSYTETRTGSKYFTGTQTGTNYSRTLTGLASTPMTATKSSDTPTATRHESETGIYSNPKTASWFETHTGTCTEKQSSAGFDTVTKSYKHQPVTKCSNKHRADIEAPSISDLSDPGTHIKRKRTNTKYADEKLKMMRTDLLQNKSWSPQMACGKKLSSKEGQRMQKFLSSTVRRSTGKLEFPSELSSVTDPSKLQQQDEKTPRKTTERFKIPCSPTKHMADRVQRKGNLEPKNSTRLFTTGFVEIVDVIPQMSTIRLEADTGTPQIEKSVPKIEENKLQVGNRQTRQNIKTSTPNKLDAVDQDYQFEIDVSSVNMDSDEEELHIHETREVNSEEILHLSCTVTEQQETTIKPDTMSMLKKSHKTVPMVKSTANKIEECVKRNNKDPIEENAKVLPKHQLNKTKAYKNPAKHRKKVTTRKTLKTIPTLSRKGKQTLCNRKSLRNKQYRKANRGSNSVKLNVEKYHVEVKKKSEGHEPVVPDIDKTIANVKKEEGPVFFWSSSKKPAKSIVDEEPDVYDIDNSVVNSTSPWPHKIARQNSRLNINMAEENGLLLKKALKFNKAMETNSLCNDLSLPVEINKKSSKFTVPQRKKSTSKDFSDTNDDEYSELACKKLNTSRVIHCIPVCSLGNKGWFRGPCTLTVYEHEDHRSHQEILNTVLKDDLLLMTDGQLVLLADDSDKIPDFFYS